MNDIGLSYKMALKLEMYMEKEIEEIAQDFQNVGSGENAHKQGVEDGKNNEGALPDGNLDLPNEVCNENEDEGQDI